MNRQFRQIWITALAALTLGACGAEQGGSATVAESAGAEPEATVATAGLNSDYLEGTWCYAYWESMGESEEPNETYIFNADGSLLYQHASGGTVDAKGSWEVDGDRLKILPKFTYFNLVIRSVAPDEFVLDNIGFHHFRRGACGA